MANSRKIGSDAENVISFSLPTLLPPAKDQHLAFALETRSKEILEWSISAIPFT